MAAGVNAVSQSRRRLLCSAGSIWACNDGVAPLGSPTIASSNFSLRTCSCVVGKKTPCTHSGVLATDLEHPGLSISPVHHETKDGLDQIEPQNHSNRIVDETLGVGVPL
jgi:hypothetical protein